MSETIAILDFGSQYTQLIARRVREAQVYCELFPWDVTAEKVLALQPKGFILSGGPASVYTKDAPRLPSYVLESGLPVLGICYGMQALTQALGGEVRPASEREYGLASVEPLCSNPLLMSAPFSAWMSHGDRITRLPAGFTPLARSNNSPIAAMGNLQRQYYGVQFHPEVKHTVGGEEILRRFVLEICGIQPVWTPSSIIETSVAHVRTQVRDKRALVAVSGGVDSTVAAALAYKAIGDQLTAIFVDTGLLRQGEPEQVTTIFSERLGIELITVNAAKQFFTALKDVTDPERKRKIIGDRFIRSFEREARRLGQPQLLVQGTIYPDVIESSAPERNKAERIKTHHNVGGLPKDLPFELVEPLRYLFKDEVRAVGEALELPGEVIWRQPFPGPGLAVRCLGEVTLERVARLRAADAILLEELTEAGLLGERSPTAKTTHAADVTNEDPACQQLAQAFVVLLPVRTVGIMGDQRTFQEVAAIRAVVSDDFMTADWARIPYDILSRVAKRVVNEVHGINRVVYDITSKPPATIEWE